ncbi:MAG: DEAD/DEAH box helicase [Desulfobacterales bacterium]|nr:MAG: DEAD/DEAH box helicase [Desulfobacterales bacterium]
MKRRRRYSPNQRHFPRKKPRSQPFKPGEDSKLKSIFAEIGVPDRHAFRPDPFQVKALAAIEHTDCLVSAPTGAGKTWIAEKAIARIHAQGGNAWYACPLKALSNAKYAEFSAIFGAEQVGILTGDRKENPDAAIVVGTTEILRNQLYDAMHRGESLSADIVVLDEAHFLGDADRGVVWEEIIIYLPVRIPLLLLSATVGNADQIAGWLASIRKKKCIVIAENTRPVPLYPLFLHPSGTLLPLIFPPKAGGKAQLYKKVRDFMKAKRTKQRRLSPNLPPFDDILRILQKYDLLPAIFFLKSRADCDQALDLCRRHRMAQPQRKEKITQEISEFSQFSPHILHHRQLWHLTHLALGSHHSGQLPSWKLVLEKLMTAGLLDAVFATSTVSAGVNFPARTVVFLNSDRFNGHQFLPLNPTEFHQMTGRAGRRGMDNIGFALSLPNKFMDIRLIAKLLHSPPIDVLSQIRINFSMVLNLLLSHKPGEIEELLKKSFASYLRRKTSSKQQRNIAPGDLWPDFLHHLDFLQQTGFVSTEGELTDDGRWASQLRVDQPLLIAEGFRRGLFPESDPAQLAALISSFVNERESDDRAAKKKSTKSVAKAFATLVRGLKPFAGQMLASGFEVRPLFLNPTAATFAWVGGQPWEKVLNLSEMEEGDLAMLLLRTADNLRHVRALIHVFPQAATSAAAAIEMILREPVVYY